MTPDAYARQLKQLLPPGLLWQLEEGSWLSRLLAAIAEELARVDARGDDLVEEWDPATADETIADWERVLGLPEFGAELAATLADRQVAAAAKYAARGGQTPAYFVELAARAGFVASYDKVSAYTWRLTVPLAQATVAYTTETQAFRAGAARAGDRVASVTVPELEVFIRRASPAHTSVWFRYT